MITVKKNKKQDIKLMVLISSFLSLFLFVSNSILFLQKPSNQIIINLKKNEISSRTNSVMKDKYKKLYNRLLIGLRKWEIIDVSDLGLNQNEVKQVYAFIMNNLTPLFPYLTPPQRNAPSNFFVKDELTGQWNGQIDARPRQHSLNRNIEKSQQMFEKMSQIIKFIPFNNDKRSYIYWMYSFISNWISYDKRINDSQLFVTSLLSRKGICESYSKMSQFFFNIFGIDAVYQTGNLKSGIARGDHIWNKYKVGDKWFNFDTTSASTAETGYYLKPIGDYLAFSDSDFSSKRNQYATWYENSVKANVDTSDLNNLIPFNNSLKTKKWVYKDKWYYLNHQTMQLIESDVDNQSKIVIKKINRAFDQQYISSFLTLMVGNELFWIDKNEMGSFILSKYNVDTKKYENIITFENNLEIHSMSLSDFNEISITTYNEMQGTQTIKKVIENNYDFFQFTPNEITQKALASLMSLYFMQFEIGYNKGQLLERNYLKYTDIITKAFVEKEFNQEIYNKLKTFKKDISKDLNKEDIAHIENPIIDDVVNIDLYENLLIKPKIKYENVDLNQLSFKWFVSSNKIDWFLLEGQNKENLTINNIGKNYEKKFVKMEIHYQETVTQSNACFININKNVKYPQIKLSFNENNKKEFNIGDKIHFNITSSEKDLSSNRFNLYKKENQYKELIIENQTVENIFYIVKKEDLFKNLEFLITNKYFDDILKSPAISIKIKPEIIPNINNNNVLSIKDVKLDQEIQFYIKTPNSSLFKFDWKYDQRYFKKIFNFDDLSSITLKVINDNINNIKIGCDVLQINSSSVYKSINFDISFLNNNSNVIPEKPNHKNFLWLYLSLGILISGSLIILIVFIKRKGKK